MKTSFKSFFMLAAGLFLITSCNNDDDDGQQPGTPAQPDPIDINACLEDDTEVVEVVNPATGKIWMDRNLGASRAATSATDSAAYGYLYQWGRHSDGHQCRNAETTDEQATDPFPGHGFFIAVDDNVLNWMSPQNSNLWQGAEGINNPCPEGFRLPTAVELDEERMSWISNDAAGAFGSPLKLPKAGSRGNGGSLFIVGEYGYYWSSVVPGSGGRMLGFHDGSAGMADGNRVSGRSIRCIKD